MNSKTSWTPRLRTFPSGILSIALCVFAGCSGDEGLGVAAKKIDGSEISAIKKTAKTPQELSRNLRNKIRETEGLDPVPTPPTKTAKKKR